MISRRSILIGGGVTIALAGGVGLLRVSSVADDIRQPLLYAFALHEFASRIRILSGQVSGPGLVNEELVKAQYPDWQGEPIINREVHVRDLSGPTSRSVTTPNNDTLYTSAVLDLSVGAIEIIAPDSSERYFSIAFMDPFSDQVAYIGTRATDGRGGRYWIIGPKHSPDIPEDVTPISVDSNDVWMLGRVFVAGSEDLEDARAFQSQISVRPLNPSATPKPFAVKPSEQSDARTFLALVNEVLARNPATKHAKRASQFADFGIVPGRLDAFDSLSQAKRYVWMRAVDQIEEEIAAQIALDEKTSTGWTTPPRILGRYGTNDEVRAGTAMVGFGALTAKEAVYYKCITDAAGTPLNGSKAYQMMIPAEGVPTDAFWSLSIYGIAPDKRLYFYENELDRYAINSHDPGLLFQPDGSVVLALQRERPSDPSFVWMPTPEGDFHCVFRAYLPDRAIREGRWTPPSHSPERGVVRLTRT